MTNNEILEALKERETELEQEVNHYAIMKAFEGDEKQQFRVGLLYAENKATLELYKKAIGDFEQLNNLSKDIEKELDEENPDIAKLLMMYAKLKRKLREQ